MDDTPHTDRRIDPDHREPSPSTGWQETALLLDVPYAHAADSPVPPVGVVV